MKKIFLLSALLILFTSCASTTYMNIADEKGSRDWGPLEINKTVETMTGSLYAFLKESKNPAYLELKKIKNRTSEHIDTQMIGNMLTTNLIKKRIPFVDRSKRKEAIEEMQIGQSGLIDEATAIPMGNLKSPNFILEGDVSDNLRSVSGNRIQYLVVTLKLTELSSGQIIWQEQQEFLKKSTENKLTW